MYLAASGGWFFECFRHGSPTRGFWLFPCLYNLQVSDSYNSFLSMLSLPKFFSQFGTPVGKLGDDPPWDFLHRMGGHKPLFCADQVFGQKMGLGSILSFCRDPSRIVELLDEYIFSIVSFVEIFVPTCTGILGHMKKSGCHFVETISRV